MKTLRLFTLCLAIFMSAGTAAAQTPANSYTLIAPCQPLATFSAIPNTYGCFSFSVMTAGASDPNGYFSWNFGDGAIGTGSVIYHCYSPSTVTVVYTITVAYNSTLCVPPLQQTFTVALNPPAQGQCVRPVPSISLAAQSVTVWTGSAIPEEYYTFNYGDGTPTGMLNTHSYTACGNYIVEVQDGNINMPPTVCYAYVAVNIACPSTNTVVTGMDEKDVENARVRVFPNPSSGIINISSNLPIHGIKVVDLSGRECLLQQASNNAQHVTLQVSRLPAGVYFLTVQLEMGSRATTKFIRE